MTPARIQQLRLAVGQSTDAFGARFGRSGRTVEAWEQGRRRPDPYVLRALARLARTRLAVPPADTPA